jgi:hypothetical protein
LALHPEELVYVMVALKTSGVFERQPAKRLPDVRLHTIECISSQNLEKTAALKMATVSARAMMLC